MERKSIVNALENHFNVKAKYMKAPSFAYEIETNDGVFTIGRDGKISDVDGKEYELEELINPNDEKIVDEESVFEVVLDFDNHTGRSLRNLINMLYSKQSFIKKVFDIEEDFIQSNVIEPINKDKNIKMKEFVQMMESVDESECVGLKFDFDIQQLTFRFYEGEIELDKVNAYTQLVSLVNQKAKEVNRASFKETISDNPKYTFRTWLLRLGVIGDEYKGTRKILLANLEGNTAFRHSKLDC